jgi:PAS domain S-box-containing protein
VVLVFRDVTERNRAEEALRESEQRLFQIIDFLPDATFAIDLDGKVIAWNRAIEEMTGVKAERMLGRGHHEYALPFYGIRRTVLIDLVFTSDEETKSKYHFIKKEGDILWAEGDVPVKGEEPRVLWGKARPLHDSEGNIVGAIETLRDITERKLAEEERMRLATAIEQSAEGMFITDTNWIIQYTNPAFQRVAGYGKYEIIGQHTRILKSDRHDGAFYGKIRDTLVQGKVWSGRLTNKKKDGTFYEADVTASPVRDNSGLIINYVGIHRDITHEARLESKLRQAQKMEAIGTLAGGIAHDFNNILGAIIGFSEMALSKVDQGSPLRRNMEMVLDAGYRAADLVKQILTFSRQTEQERRPIRIGLTVKEALKLLRSSLPTTIEIRQELEFSPRKDMVLADSTQIHQVLMNLCTNAAHAMRAKGGVLSVRVWDTVTDASLVSRHPDLREGPYVVLTVSDTGHGIDPAIMERIFDPYFTTKGIGEGTGIGLAVVQGIVRSYGGAITVYSEPGKGTTFNVYLPGIQEETVPEAVAHEVLPTGSERILFVDDERSLTELGEEMLESLGYKVTAMTGSVEALEVFRAQPEAFDLVITDMTMPHLTGKDLAKELMAIREDIPIILCTGFSELINGKQCKDAGIREFIMKPYVTSNVANVIRKVLEQK